MNLAAALLAFSMIGSAFATEKLNYKIELEFNTHPNHPCPELREFTLSKIKGDMLLTLGSGEQTVLRWMGNHTMSNSDVSQDIWDSYSGALDIALSYNTDGNYPARLTGGFSEISLGTGVQERNGVYWSQSCYYKLK